MDVSGDLDSHLSDPSLGALLQSPSRPHAVCDSNGVVSVSLPPAGVGVPQYSSPRSAEPATGPPEEFPQLHLIAGPNGAGKTTLFEHALGPSLPQLPFVNADRIAASELPGDPMTSSYAAARIAVERRRRLIEHRMSFATETVFSHASKAGLTSAAVDAGYQVHLYVVAVPEELSVQRVKCRVAMGGHDVPEDKIRARHRRMWAHLEKVCQSVHEVRVYDNGSDCYGMMLHAVSGRIAVDKGWPKWALRRVKPLRDAVRQGPGLDAQ